jgi:hypothetical protein
MDTGLQPLVDNLRNRLSKLSDETDTIKRPSLGNELVAGGLRDLARHGSLLYDRLVCDILGRSWAEKESRIQVIAAHADAYLPIEFIYDRPSPSPDGTPNLCPKTSAALKAGKCRECFSKDTEWRAYVCPLRFWGLRHIIERYVFDPSLAKTLGPNDFDLQQEPTDGRRSLHILKHGLFGGSQRADAVRPGLRAKLFKTLSKVVEPTAVNASDWTEWKTGVGKIHPTFQLLVPHTFKDGAGIPTMEIGKDALLAVDQVDAAYVRADAQSEPPMVALLGCETASVDQLYASFVAKLRLQGAAIIICTLSTVLGRHMGVVASILLEELNNSAVSMGEVLRRVRQRSLAAGICTGLGLVGYGDAEWRLEK